MPESKNQYEVPGLERGLRLLSQFTREEPRLAAPDLAQRLGIPRTTVFRLLQTLEREGFVERVEDSRFYSLGIAVLRLGFEYLSSLSLVELGRPLLDKLRDQTGMSVNLVVRDGRSVIYVARSGPISPFASVVNVGTRLPAHATVVGRVLLSALTLDELRRLYPERRLPKSSGQTPETIDALHAMLQADAERGYAISEGFFEPTVSTVASPVRDDTTQVVAALGVSSYRTQLDPDLLKNGLVEKVLEAAFELSRNLNYRGDAFTNTLARVRAAQRETRKKGRSSVRAG